MPRDLPASFKQRIFGVEDDEPTIMLATIEHDDLPGGVPLRVCCNTEDLEHGGELYLKFLFLVAWPSQVTDQLPQVQLRIDSVDQRIIEALQTVTTAPTIVLTLVGISDWTTSPKKADAFIVETPRMLWGKSRYNQSTAWGSLEGPAFLDTTYPHHNYTPSIAPGIHAGR